MDRVRRAISLFYRGKGDGLKGKNYALLGLIDTNVSDVRIVSGSLVRCAHATLLGLLLFLCRTGRRGKEVETSAT